MKKQSGVKVGIAQRSYHNGFIHYAGFEVVPPLTACRLTAFSLKILWFV
jgi:hypothetical protein